MNKIYEKSIGFFLLKKVVIASFSIFYRKISIFGTENIPLTEGPIIFAPVHQNALMDALAVHSTFPGQIIFMMRGDVFSENIISRFLQYIKIIPIFRKRDGKSQLIQDNVCFENAIDALCMGKCVALMPEGNQKEQKRLRTLGKGIFRIGFQAQKQLGNSKEVTILPIGLDFEDYDHTGGCLIINAGHRLSFKKLMTTFDENPAYAYNLMKEQLSESLHKLIIDIRDEKNYSTYYLATLLATEKKVIKKEIKDSDETRFAFRKMIANRFPANADETIPDDLQPFVDEASFLLQKESDPRKAFIMSQKITVAETAKAIVYTSFMLPSLILNGLPYFLIRRFTSRHFKDIGFVSSATFIGGFLLFPFYWIFMFGLFCIITTPLRSLFLFLLLSPLLVILSIRVLHIYENLFLKLRYRIHNR